jgi:hypothetical protein
MHDISVTLQTLRPTSSDLILDVGAGAFDKAVCLNALHHVPDMAAARVTWFEPTGSQTAAHDLLVEGGV